MYYQCGFHLWYILRTFYICYWHTAITNIFINVYLCHLSLLDLYTLWKKTALLEGRIKESNTADTGTLVGAPRSIPLRLGPLSRAIFCANPSWSPINKLAPYFCRRLARLGLRTLRSDLNITAAKLLEKYM